MIITNETQLASLRRIGRVAAQILQQMRDHAEPGMSTAELDALGGALLDQAGAQSAPQLSYGFPGFTCISINEEAAHGIPGERLLQAGDLINIDVSAVMDGVFADTGGSFVLATSVTTEGRNADIDLKQRLCRAALQARDAGVAIAHAGQRLNLIGRRIERVIHAAGFRNVRNLCGHGVGLALHEEPTVRNYFDMRDTDTLQEGQVITIEPFLSTNAGRVRELADGWTLAGRPSSLFAQHEHTLVVTRGEPIIVTI